VTFGSTPPASPTFFCCPRPTGPDWPDLAVAGATVLVAVLILVT
jgi:hypothetical protein